MAAAADHAPEVTRKKLRHDTKPNDAPPCIPVSYTSYTIEEERLASGTPTKHNKTNKTKRTHIQTFM